MAHCEALFSPLVPLTALYRTAHGLGLATLLWGCGPDAEARFAGLSVEHVSSPTGPNYRLRYLTPPWKKVANDPLVKGDSHVQFGVRDSEGDTSQPDLLPLAESSRVLEIERSVQSDGTLPDGVVTYPKYRLEVSALDCEALGIDPAPQNTCAERLRNMDEGGRSEGDTESLLGAHTREGENAFGQRYHELMAQVQATRRFRRVVYFETDRPTLAIRLGFEANPDLGESEITRMIEAFELLETSEP